MGRWLVSSPSRESAGQIHTSPWRKYAWMRHRTVSMHLRHVSGISRTSWDLHTTQKERNAGTLAPFRFGDSLLGVPRRRRGCALAASKTRSAISATWRHDGLAVQNTDGLVRYLFMSGTSWPIDCRCTHIAFLTPVLRPAPDKTSLKSMPEVTNASQVMLVEYQV